MINILSFNILTNVYCIIGPKGYSKDHYGINYFRFETRLNKIKNILQSFMEKDTIICLQEVDIPFSEELQVFFNLNNYNFYYHPYGYGMGVVTAVPMRFAVRKIYRYNPMEEAYPKDIGMKIGHAQLPWPKSPQMSWSNWFWKKMGYNTQDYASYKNFIYRKNYTLFLEVEVPENNSPNYSTYLIGNIHMPCQYQEPSFMEAYLYLVRFFIQWLYIGNHYKGEYILAGDFNSQPKSLAYDMMVKGALSNTTLDWIKKNFPSEAWQKFGILNDLPQSEYTIFPAMKSALYFGSPRVKEPDYTCKAHSRGNDFTGTIDYIFISQGLQSITAGVSTAIYSDNAYLPNSLEPSDHLPIYAEIKNMD